MATVTSKTAAAIDVIDNAGIVSGHLDGSSHLILVKKDNSTIDCGSIAITSTPPGTVVMYGGASAPSGWLLCNGQAVSRATYASLWTALGTTYGSGDGSSTFNVPNLETKFPRMEAAARGATGGSSTANHTHTVPSHVHSGHQHHLDGGDPTGYAKCEFVTGTGNNFHAQRVDVDNYDTNILADLGNCSLTSGNVARGIRLGGDTNPGGGLQNNVGQMVSDPAGGLPPYLNLNFIIKT
jgi:microcystin-dependent protein